MPNNHTNFYASVDINMLYDVIHREGWNKIYKSGSDVGIVIQFSFNQRELETGNGFHRISGWHKKELANLLKLSQIP